MSKTGKPKAERRHRGKLLIGKTITSLGPYPLPRTLAEAQDLNRLLDGKIDEVTFRYKDGVTIEPPKQD